MMLTNIFAQGLRKYDTVDIRLGRITVILGNPDDEFPITSALCFLKRATQGKGNGILPGLSQIDVDDFSRITFPGKSCLEIGLMWDNQTKVRFCLEKAGSSLALRDGIECWWEGNHYCFIGFSQPEVNSRVLQEIRDYLYLFFSDIRLVSCQGYRESTAEPSAISLLRNCAGAVANINQWLSTHNVPVQIEVREVVARSDLWGIYFIGKRGAQYFPLVALLTGLYTTPPGGLLLVQTDPREHKELEEKMAEAIISVVPARNIAVLVETLTSNTCFPIQQEQSLSVSFFSAFY